jgi:hypothetical protein
LGGRGRQISEFKASLVYKVSSRTAKATQRNPVSKKPKKKKKLPWSWWLFTALKLLSKAEVGNRNWGYCCDRLDSIFVWRYVAFSSTLDLESSRIL